MSQEPEENIIFLNDRGGRYVWPYELCRSFDAIKPLLEEVYTLLEDQHRLDEIKQGKYEIQNENGDTILPSVWNAIVKPSTTIQIAFQRNRSRRRRWSSSDSKQDDLPSRIDEEKPDENPPNVRFNVDEEPGLESDNSGSQDEDDDDLDSLSSPESEDEPADPAEILEPFREVIVPVDSDGNKLSFGVDTSRPARHQHPTKESPNDSGSPKAVDKPKDATETHPEPVRITKAVSAEIENRNMIQIHTLPGPENVHLRDSVSMTWYHMTGSRLDFTRFRNMCLALPNLSDRTQTLVREILKKVEEHKIKAFLDGMFIEPGTVMRADDRAQPYSQSVVFSCIPYFDLQPPVKKLSTGQGDRLFPPRTLMQSYYPYEPVRDRDAEQAYKKFGNDRSGSILNVPNLWMLNIGSNVVVTCGHKPLAVDLTKSIEVIPEDLKKLGNKEITKDTLTEIRLTDWEGRVILFPLESCRTYFQLEQKVRELKYTARGSLSGKMLQLVYKTADGQTKVEPRLWTNLVRRTDQVFIDLTFVDDKTTKKGTIANDNPATVDSGTALDVPPFFYWPTPPKDMSQSMTSSQTGGVSHCLEHVEKIMLSETLDDYETTNAVDKTFTSTTFYHWLPEDTYESVRPHFLTLRQDSFRATESRSKLTHHQVVMSSQSSEIRQRAAVFFEHVHATLQLFVPNVEIGTMLRKVWGAMLLVHNMVANIAARSDIRSKDSSDAKTIWFIRSDVKDKYTPSPEASDRFKRSVRRCKRCQSSQPFVTEDDALQHLQKHIAKLQPRPSNVDDAEGLAKLLSIGPSDSIPPTDANLKDWVISFTQAQIEELNAGALAILELACKTTEDLFLQARELAEGVQDETGRISDLYVLPRQIVEAFREIIVFYFAIERALYHTEMQTDEYGLPYSEDGLEVLRRFGEGARRSLGIARAELCSMVASPGPLNVFKCMSLGPQYVCAWLMRRLIVQPVEKRMTVGDMYREYLSTIQFQVNHRPGKRLLRSINLLQEELRVLVEINTWQTKLIQNYTQVLDDATYEKEIPSRQAMFPHERLLLRSCLENLSLSREEYGELIRRCAPLSDSTKQSLEINEEDHGKAIMVFTTVTVIFLPLSFVTSYFGMNTVDIRDMESKQSLFWVVALPLTLVTLGTCLAIGYNGDVMLDLLSSVYRKVTGKEDRSISARGISVAQRKRARKLQSDSSSTLDTSTLADEVEYASPRPEYWMDEYTRKAPVTTYNKAMVADAFNPPDLLKTTETVSYSMPAPRSRLQTSVQTKTYNDALPVSVSATAAAAPVPTYMRINKHYVALESLQHYNLPFETDPADPSFFLIKQELNRDEARMLFEHTRRLRQGAGRGSVRREAETYNKVYSAPKERAEAVYGMEEGVEDRPVEYTWHKKRRGRQSRVAMAGVMGARMAGARERGTWRGRA